MSWSLKKSHNLKANELLIAAMMTRTRQLKYYPTFRKKAFKLKLSWCIVQKVQNFLFRSSANSLQRSLSSTFTQRIQFLTQIEKVLNKIAECLLVKSRMMVRRALKTTTKVRIYVFSEKIETKTVCTRQHEKFKKARIESRC